MTGNDNFTMTSVPYALFLSFSAIFRTRFSFSQFQCSCTSSHLSVFQEWGRVRNESLFCRSKLLIFLHVSYYSSESCHMSPHPHPLDLRVIDTEYPKLNSFVHSKCRMCLQNRSILWSQVASVSSAHCISYGHSLLMHFLFQFLFVTLNT